jgi:uncharacterized membrane protein
MIEQYYNFCHQTLHTSMYTIPLIIAAIALIVVLAVHMHGMHKRKKLSETDAKIRRNGSAAGSSVRNA